MAHISAQDPELRDYAKLAVLHSSLVSNLLGRWVEFQINLAWSLVILRLSLKQLESTFSRNIYIRDAKASEK